eukprot:40098-Amphidinium_carterae.1
MTDPFQVVWGMRAFWRLGEFTTLGSLARGALWRKSHVWISTIHGTGLRKCTCCLKVFPVWCALGVVGPGM